MNDKVEVWQTCRNLLQRILTSFPNSHLILTGYYPFFSENTRNDFVLRALAKKFFQKPARGSLKDEPEGSI
jgi:hypothetical protein